MFWENVWKPLHEISPSSVESTSSPDILCVLRKWFYFNLAILCCLRERAFFEKDICVKPKSRVSAVIETTNFYSCFSGKLPTSDLFYLLTGGFIFSWLVFNLSLCHLLLHDYKCFWIENFKIPHWLRGEKLIELSQGSTYLDRSPLLGFSDVTEKRRTTFFS